MSDTPSSKQALAHRIVQRIAERFRMSTTDQGTLTLVLRDELIAADEPPVVDLAEADGVSLRCQVLAGEASEEGRNKTTGVLNDAAETIDNLVAALRRRPKRLSAADVERTEQLFAMMHNAQESNALPAERASDDEAARWEQISHILIRKTEQLAGHKLDPSIPRIEQTVFAAGFVLGRLSRFETALIELRATRPELKEIIDKVLEP